MSAQRFARHLLVLAALMLLAATRLTAAPAETDYQRALRAYTAAHTAFEEAAGAYWHQVSAKRHLRIRKRRDRQDIRADDYVLTQPPAYSGPPEPVNPAAPPQEKPPVVREYVPVVADFLAAAKTEFGFVPRRPRDELDYKQGYARVAAAAGLTKDQVVRIYGFEVGGNGTYDLQAGLEYPKPGARALTTALGYNQLLSTNSVGLLAEKGERFIAVLEAKAARLNGDEQRALRRKISILHAMIAFCRTVPDRWMEHDRLGKTPRGWGVQAILLDIDVGPLLQTQKLVDSVAFARRKGYAKPMTAAELEMMNLTGDGNGFDIVAMPQDLRVQVPTSNFFLRKAYGRNPVARRNNTVAKLLAATDAKMDKEAKLKGARDLAAAYPK
jgi:hypothetical protein